MAWIHDITPESFIEPQSSSLVAVSLTSRSSQFDVFVRNPEPSILTIPGLIKRPRRVNKGAWKGFRTRLHDLVPQMNNLTHEQMESIIDERNQDFLDNAD